MSHNTFLRHTLATINYRANASICHAPSSFPKAQVGSDHWTAMQTLSHINDVLTWACSIAKGDQEWQADDPSSWQDETNRFYAVLKAFDRQLEEVAVDDAEAMRLLQGPLADVLTHVGQLASLRRLSGKSVPPQNYHVADIQAGILGADVNL